MTYLIVHLGFVDWCLRGTAFGMFAFIYGFVFAIMFDVCVILWAGAKLASLIAPLVLR